MAVVAASSPDTQEPVPPKPDQETPASIPQDASPLSTPPTSAPPPAAAAAAAPASAAENPISILPGPSNPPVVTPPPPAVPSFTPAFRPVGAPTVPQYTPLANPNFPNPAYPSPGLQPPGVSAPPVSMVPGAAPGSGAMPIAVPPLQPPGVYQAPSGQMPTSAPGSYVQTPNGYMAIPPPGIPRYPAPYPTMVRPGFPPRPLGPPIGGIPALSRPPIQGIRGAPLVMPPVVRPAVPVIAPAEKPQTTVYVGKIATTVENEFLESLLRLCGPVKSWKRVENPSDGTFRGFGFCEFESAEGVLRALRLLSKLNIDGQELVLNVNQATREYLERYVHKKVERQNLNESEAKASEKETVSPSAVEKQEPTPSAVDNSEENGGESGDKEKEDNAQTFGIVNDEDRDADKDALEKLTSMLEERLKNKPLPPPPPMDNATDPAKSNSEAPTKSRDGDSDVDIVKNDAGEDKKEEEMTSDAKLTADHDRYEAGSDRARRRDRSRERDRERDLKREKERELERYERERERERVRREREREMKIREAERLYKDHVKEWEAREREKESQRQREIEREKERARERRREIKDQEIDSDDDDTRKRRHRSGMLEEKRRKRQREKEEDLLDRLREEEEIAEAKRRTVEEHKKQKEETKSSDQVTEKSHDLTPKEENFAENDGHPDAQPYDDDDNAGDATLPNGNGSEIPTELTTGSDVKQGTNISSRKLGFGLMASGKRATVPSVFHEEDDEDMDKEKKMRPLVPIDYSTEELQAVQATPSGTPPNLVAAAEFAKRITSVNLKEEKPDMERERSKRSSDRTSHRDRSRDDEEHTRVRDEIREKLHDKISHRGREQEDKVKTVENKKLLDAKQLIDMIPKTKEKLFAYEINWEIYDKHELHERMRPWISKKITEFLGEEEATLVDYIVSSTREHVHASQMLELLQSILDDEAEMFVLKMWRMLIFEIKKVETGLNLKSKA